MVGSDTVIGELVVKRLEVSLLFIDADLHYSIQSIFEKIEQRTFLNRITFFSLYHYLIGALKEIELNQDDRTDDYCKIW